MITCNTRKCFYINDSFVHFFKWELFKTYLKIKFCFVNCTIFPAIKKTYADENNCKRHHNYLKIEKHLNKSK